jgi:adenylate cyclase
VLCHLAAHAGRLVPKQELYNAVWPKVTVSDDSLVQCIRELRHKLGDDRHRLIKTVSRRGYLLDTTVTTPPQRHIEETATGGDRPSVIADGSTISDVIADGDLPVASRRLRVAGLPIVLLAAVIVAGALWAATRAHIPAQTDSGVVVERDRQVSLVVLPFKNFSGDPEQEYFADGVTEDLTNSMSRFDMTLIGFGTAFFYKGKPIDVRQVGRDLGVRYVLEGSVSRLGDQVRVTAQLTHALTAANIWTEAFDVNRSELDAVRDDVTARLASILKVELVYAENGRSFRERARDPDARDFLWRARALFNEDTLHGADMSEPRRLLQEALRRDASLMDAWIELAMTYLYNIRFSPTHAQDVLQAEEAVERAMALDPRSPRAHLAMGWVRYEQRRIDVALIEFEHAVQLNPNQQLGYGFIAAANVVLGRPENALEPLRKAMRFSPSDPGLQRWQMVQGVVYLHLQRDVEAVDSLKKAVALNPRDAFARLFLASALDLSGREGEAKLEIAELLRLQPAFTLSRFQANEASDIPAFRTQRQRIYEALRRTGLPE